MEYKKTLISSLLAVTSITTLYSCSNDYSIKQTTYYDVKPILEKSCLNCHGRTSHIPIGPLKSYEEMVSNSEVILEQLKTGEMPPYDITSDGIEYKSSKILSPKERNLLINFLKYPIKGSQKESALPKIFNSQNITTFKKRVKGELKPRGVLFKCYVFDIPASLYNKYVTGVEINLNGFNYVHHTGYAFHQIKSNNERTRIVSDDIAGCYLQKPFNFTRNFPKDFGIHITPKLSLILHVHLDRSFDESLELFKFENEISIQVHTKDKIKYPFMLYQLYSTDINVPYNQTAKTTKLTSVTEIRGNLKIQSSNTLALSTILLHMHLFGTKARLTRIDPIKQTEQILLSDNRYRFLTQSALMAKKPIVLKDTDILKLECFYDNRPSRYIVRKINKTKYTVYNGSTAKNDMCIALLNFIQIDKNSLDNNGFY